jgi:hypothetical protein
MSPTGSCGHPRAGSPTGLAALRGRCGGRPRRHDHVSRPVHRRPRPSSTMTLSVTGPLRHVRSRRLEATPALLSALTRPPSFLIGGRSPRSDACVARAEQMHVGDGPEHAALVWGFERVSTARARRTGGDPPAPCSSRRDGEAAAKQDRSGRWPVHGKGTASVLAEPDPHSAGHEETRGQGRRGVGSARRTGGRGRHRSPEGRRPRPGRHELDTCSGRRGRMCGESLQGLASSSALWFPLAKRISDDATRENRLGASSQGTSRPPARGAVNRMAFVPTRCRSPELAGGDGGGRDPDHRRVPYWTR